MTTREKVVFCGMALLLAAGLCLWSWQVDRRASFLVDVIDKPITVRVDETTAHDERRLVIPNMTLGEPGPDCPPQCPPAAPIMRGEIRAIVDMLGDLVSHPPMTCAYGAVRTTEYEASWRCLTEAEVATITKLERS